MEKTILELKFKPFLKILYSSKESRKLIGYCRFSCLYGTYFELLLAAAKRVNWPVSPKNRESGEGLTAPSGPHARYPAPSALLSTGQN